jgi:hypothetical protein
MIKRTSYDFLFGFLNKTMKDVKDEMYDRDLGISHEIKEKPKIVAPKVHDSTTVA